MRASVRKPTKAAAPDHQVERARRELEWRKCKGDHPYDVDACVYFLANYWYVLHPKHGAVLLEVRDYQREMLAVWLSDDSSIALKARQIGFTTLGAAMVFWETWFWPDHNDIFLSRTEREASKILAQVKRGWRKLPVWLKQMGPQPQSTAGGSPGTLTLIEWDNDSSIEALPSSEDPARGLSLYRIFGDEWAFLKNPEDAWASVRPAVGIGGRINIVSTAKGLNWFHNLWQGATTSSPPAKGFRHMFFPWHVVPGRDEAWYRAERENFAEWQMHQEYPSTPEEAFRRSGNLRFDLGILDAQPATDPLFVGEILPQQIGAADLLDAPEGRYLEWDSPQKDARYVVGADVAEGLESGDYSSAHVIDVSTMEVVAVWHGHCDPDEYASILNALGLRWNKAYLGVEMNNHGLTTTSRLKRMRYPNLFYRRVMGRRNESTPTEAVGWKTTSISKTVMIDALDENLRAGVLRVNDEFTLDELKRYRIEYSRTGKPTMSGQPHDDRVMSLALATQMVQYQSVPGYKPDGKPPPGSFGAYKAEIESEQRRTGKRVPVGAHNGR